MDALAGTRWCGLTGVWSKAWPLTRGSACPRALGMAKVTARPQQAHCSPSKSKCGVARWQGQNDGGCRVRTTARGGSGWLEGERGEAGTKWSLVESLLCRLCRNVNVVDRGHRRDEELQQAASLVAAGSPPPLLLLLLSFFFSSPLLWARLAAAEGGNSPQGG